MKYFILILLPLKLFAFDQKHSEWNEILKKYLVEDPVSNLFDYKSMKASSNELNNYLNKLESVTKADFQKFKDKEKLAFWINAYNAYTIKLIIDNYPIKSIKDIKGDGFFGWGSPWEKKFITLFGEKMHLDHIEHEIIRKQFNEPRIHFAVNCASMGCPSLVKEAYRGDALDVQLQRSTLKFLTNKNKNEFDHSNKIMKLSKIFEWYGDDFNKKYGSYLNFIRKFHPDGNKTKDYKVDFKKYGWELNGVK